MVRESELYCKELDPTWNNLLEPETIGQREQIVLLGIRSDMK